MKIPTISGKQVNLLVALFLQAGLRKEQERLEFIEYEVGFEVKRLEDLNNGQLQNIIHKLKTKYNLEVY